MITPKEIMKMEEEKYAEERLVKDIDKSIRNFFDNNSKTYQRAVLEEIVPLKIRNKIAAKYARCGWKYVYHLTSNEKNSAFSTTERTFFYFSLEPIMDQFENWDDFYLIQRSEVNMNEFAIYKDNKLVENFSLENE